MMGSSSKKGHDSASRAERKAKKRALEDSIPALPGDKDEQVEEKSKSSKKRKRGEEDVAEGIIGEEDKKEKKKEKKRRRREEAAGSEMDTSMVDAGAEEEVSKKGRLGEKKSKKDRESAAAVEEPTVGPENAVEGEAAPKKSKKERKAERRAKELGGAAAREKGDAAPVVETNGDAPGKEGEASAEKTTPRKNNRNREKKRKGLAAGEGDAANGTSEKPAGKEKAARFIVFTGNLPFTATTESVTKHFAAVKPISVRHLTQKDDPSKSKGCAFVEFEGYDHMKTCLKLFHHSMFDDGISAPRKINVELTAGGGGNTKDRRNKIQEKNQKLNEQRIRRIQEEEKAKLVKNTNEGAIDESAIHPSRRARVPVV